MQEQNKILDELESMGSTLGNISRGMPFTVPEHYFNELPEQMLIHVLEENIISDLPKSMPFNVPKEYFNTLPAQLLEVVKQNEKPKAKIIPLKRNLWYNMRIAAAAVLLLAAGTGIFHFTQQQNSFEKQFAALPNEAVKEYAQQNMLDLPNTNMGVTANTMTATLTEEEITNYLDETGWQ